MERLFPGLQAFSVKTRGSWSPHRQYHSGNEGPWTSLPFRGPWSTLPPAVILPTALVGLTGSGDGPTWNFSPSAHSQNPELSPQRPTWVSDPGGTRPGGGGRTTAAGGPLLFSGPVLPALEMLGCPRVHRVYIYIYWWVQSHSRIKHTLVLKDTNWEDDWINRDIAYVNLRLVI